MTRDEVQSLHAALKAVRGACLPIAGVLERWVAEHPGVSVEEARACALVTARAPFPSISGSPPVDPARPYWDGRYWQESDEDIIP